jgi:hypothetical protein
MCAVSALNPQRFRGFGPSDPVIIDQIFSLKNVTHSKVSSRPLADTSGDGDSSNELSCVVGDASTACDISSFSELGGKYKLTADSVCQDAAMSAQVYGYSRLEDILKTEKSLKKYQCPLILSQRLKQKKRKYTTSMQ